MKERYLDDILEWLRNKEQALTTLVYYLLVVVAPTVLVREKVGFLGAVIFLLVWGGAVTLYWARKYPEEEE